MIEVHTLGPAGTVDSVRVQIKVRHRTLLISFRSTVARIAKFRFDSRDFAFCFLQKLSKLLAESEQSNLSGCGSFTEFNGVMATVAHVRRRTGALPEDPREVVFQVALLELRRNRRGPIYLNFTRPEAKRLAEQLGEYCILEE